MLLKNQSEVLIGVCGWFMLALQPARQAPGWDDMSTAESRRYDRGLWFLERFRLSRLRSELLAHVAGEVLEIGVGTGANLPWYPNGRHVTGLDLNMGRLAGTATKHAARPFAPACADAQQLPFAPDLFDTVVCTLVFCSIPDPKLALAEIRRVLKPGGKLLLLEHVRGQGPISRRLTDWLQPAWFALQGECHLNRETAVTVAEAGFHIHLLSQRGRGVLQMIVAT